MASLELEMDRGQPAPASDFFMAGSELVRALDGLADEVVDWTIADLRMGFAVATLEADELHATVADKAVLELMAGLRALLQGSRSKAWNPEVVQGMKAFARLVDPGDAMPRATLTHIQGGRAIESLAIDKLLISGLSEWKPVDRLFRGSVIGRIVGVNVARGNRASLRPKTGRVVHVRFTDELANVMKDALYGQVEVFGTLRRDENDDVFHISADGVTVMEGQSALTWDKVFGSDPDFTGGVPVDRYLEESRGKA